MSADESRTGRVLTDAVAIGSAAASAVARRLTIALGGEERTHVIIVLAAILGLSGADAATVGASASELRSGLHITNTDIGLLVAVSSLVGAVATLPFGVLADRVTRTRVLGFTIVLWGFAMLWSATASNFEHLLWARLFLGAVTASAGPLVASLVGDWFGSWERGRIYGTILAGEYVGAGVGFAVTGNIAALSWRAAFVILALPAFVLAVVVWRLREPERGGKGVLAHDSEPQPVLKPDEKPAETDAQRLARERGVVPDPELVVSPDAARRMGLVSATRYVLRVRTNVVLIAASVCGYYFLAGLQTFGLEFSKEQYGIDQALASSLLLVVGLGSLAGVLAGGQLGDRLLKRGLLNARVLTPAIAAALTTGALRAGAHHTRSGDRGAVPRGRGLLPRHAEPTARCGTARHHAAAPLGTCRSGADDAALARDGPRATPLRRSLGPRLRRRPLGIAVDVPRHDPSARRQLVALVQGPADVPGRRRHRCRERGRRARLPSVQGSLGSLMSTGDTFLFLSAFLASGVEFVEALTIVLAAGLARGWRSSLAGLGAATVVLAVVVAVVGPALTKIPLNGLRLVVGGLLLIFGLQWLRKAILRASGYKALHDEDAIFSRELAEAQGAARVERAGVDWYGFTLAFKGVLLEGLEVVFIVLTFGSAQGSIPLAAAGAACALVLVAGVGIAVRAPLARVPENAMKFAVGVMLTTFGTFWSVEGAGADWPGSDAAILGVLAFVLLCSFLLVRLLRRERLEAVPA